MNEHRRLSIAGKKIREFEDLAIKPLQNESQKRKAEEQKNTVSTTVGKKCHWNSKVSVGSAGRYTMETVIKSDLEQLY